jgi:hypothetical protein
VQLAKLTSSDGRYGDWFGYSVSISGDTLVAGAPATSYGSGPGAAYVFVKPASGWTNMTQTAKLTASDGANGDNFGYTVSISGNTIAVGADQAMIGVNSAQGAAYVFVEPASGWTNMTQTAKLTASDGAAGDNLGNAVAISGSTVVAGAPRASIGSNEKQGAAYVFVESAGGWANMTQTAKLTASDGVAGDQLGVNAVSVSGNTVVAGAPALTTYGSGLGAAYVFVEPASGWANMTQTAKVTSSDRALGDDFGQAVSISGITVVVGAAAATIGTNQYQGAAYVFVEPASGWTNMTQTAKLTASDGAPSDFFGGGVSIDDSTVVVGAYNATIGPNQFQGAAYVFVEPASGWTNMTQTAKVAASDGAAGDSFGLGVSIDGSAVVAGAYNATIGSNQFQGAAYVFTNSVIVPPGCSYSIAPGSQSFTASGGNGSIVVTTPEGCQWSATSNADWIIVPGLGPIPSIVIPGEGFTTYTVESNPGPSLRAGTISLAGSTFTVTQNGSGTCTYTINPTSKTFGMSGGTVSVAVATAPGCAWTAVSKATWAIIKSGASGSGNGSVTVSVGTNSGGPRTSVLTIAGNTLSITQVAVSACGATDVTDKTYVWQGDYFESEDGSDTWTRGIEVRNSSGQTIPGPIYLVMDGLPQTGPPCRWTGFSTPTCGLATPTPITYCQSPTGSYLYLMTSGPLAPGQSVWANPEYVPGPLAGASGLPYKTRVFSGTPNQ